MPKISVTFCDDKGGDGDVGTVADTRSEPSPENKRRALTKVECQLRVGILTVVSFSWFQRDWCYDSLRIIQHLTTCCKETIKIC